MKSDTPKAKTNTHSRILVNLKAVFTLLLLTCSIYVLTIDQQSLNQKGDKISAFAEGATTAKSSALSVTGLFVFRISPTIIAPILQGTDGTEDSVISSETVVLSIETAPELPSPLSVSISVLGLPSGISVLFDGFDPATNGAGFPVKTLNQLLSGTTRTTEMNFNMDSSIVVPGHYILTLVANDRLNPDSVIEKQLAVVILPSARTNVSTLNILPTASKVGESISVFASGFDPEDPVSITFGPIPVELPSGTAFDLTGSFRANITAPELRAGVHAVIVSDSSNRALQEFEILANSDDFILSTSALIFPMISQGETTETITLSASSVGESAPIKITIKGLAPDMTASWIKGADGTFTPFDDSVLELNPERGGTESASIGISTLETTIPANYALQIIAEGLDGLSGQIKTKELELLVRPRVESSQALPSMFANPSSTPSGFPVILSAVGFIPQTTFNSVSLRVIGQSKPLIVSLDDTVIVGDDGTWSTNFDPPASAIPGIYTVTVNSAIGTQSSTAQTKLQILAGGEEPSFLVSLSPQIVNVVRVDGTGTGTIVMTLRSINQFDEPLTITSSGLPIGMAMRFSYVNGTEIATFTGGFASNIVEGSPVVNPILGGTLPIAVTVIGKSDTIDGTYSIFIGAKQVSSGDTKSGLLGVQVSSDTSTKPTLTMSSLKGQADDKVSVSGSGFISNEPVMFEFGGLRTDDGGFSIIPSPITTTGEPTGGIFAAEITVPDLSGGVYVVRAHGLMSEREAFATFTLIQPEDEGTVQLQIAPRGLVIPALSSGTQTMTISSIGPFSSRVNLIAAAPDDSDLDITFSPTSSIDITSGVPSTLEMLISTLDISAGGEIVPVTIEVRDSQSGSLLTVERTIITVHEPAGDFILSASPADLVGASGTTITSTIRIIPLGLDDQVVPLLSIGNLPPGVSGSIGEVGSGSSGEIFTTTLSLTVQDDAEIDTFPFIVTASFLGLSEKQLQMSVAVVSSPPTRLDSPSFDPASLTEKTPMQLSFPFQGNDNALTLSVKSLIGSLYGISTVEYLLLSGTPDEIGSISPGFLVIPEPGGDENRIMNMEPSNPSTSTNFEICIDLPAPLPENISSSSVKIAFLDVASQPQPNWVTLTDSLIDSSSNTVCASNINHFSSWALLATSVASPSSPGSSHGSGHGSGGSGTAIEPTTSPEEHHTFVDVFEAMSIVDNKPSNVYTTTIGISGDIFVINIGESMALIGNPFRASSDQHDSQVVQLGNWRIKPTLAGVDPLARLFQPGAKVTILFEVEAAGETDVIDNLDIDNAGPTEHASDDLKISTKVAASAHSSSDDETADTDGISEQDQSLSMIKYYLLDENGKTVAQDEFPLDGAGIREAHVFVQSPGSYILNLGGETIRNKVGGSIQTVTTVTTDEVKGLAVQVPWITANLSILIEIGLMTAGIIFGLGATFRRHTTQRTLSQSTEMIEPHRNTRSAILDRIRINLSFKAVMAGIAGLVGVSAFFIVFAGDKTGQETIGMWFANIAAGIAVFLSLLLLYHKRGAAQHLRAEVALAIGLSLWLTSRMVETWFNAVIPSLLTENVLHEVYPGDFLLTFVTFNDFNILNNAFEGNFGLIYGLFTFLKMAGFAFLAFHLFEACKLFAGKFGKRLVFASMIIPGIFLSAIIASYSAVLLDRILIEDFMVHIGYAIFIAMTAVPSSILLVALRKDRHSSAFWILSTLSLTAFLIAYSWQAFVPVGPDPEVYLDWAERNAWLSALFFGADYMLMAFAILWEVKIHAKAGGHAEAHHNDRS